MDTQLMKMLLRYIDLRFNELKSIVYHENPETRDWYATKIHNEREDILDHVRQLEEDNK